MPFRYSGSKDELLLVLRNPPIGSTKIVEPFAGSARYGIYHQPEKLYLCEANTDVYELWRWLIEDATEELLTDLEEKRVKITRSVRDLNLDKARETLMRLTCSGMYVGQLSSWVCYPQHTVDFRPIKELLYWIQNHVELIGRDFRDSHRFDNDPNVTYFIDPPYLGSLGCYIDKSTKINHDDVLTVKEIADFVSSLTRPVVFTYGDNAPEIFPMFNWNRLKTKSVPKIFAEGVKTRTEYVAYINYYHTFADGERAPA